LPKTETRKRLLKSESALSATYARSTAAGYSPITQLEKEAEGFEQHTNKSHYLWDYLYFIYHLKMKPKTEYTGVEAFVDEMLMKEDISWLPIGRSLAIEKKRGKITDKIIAMEKLEKAFEDTQILYDPNS
jgi:hypothetical protein